MKFSKKEIKYIPTIDCECYRVFEDKAYFSIGTKFPREYAFYKFKDKYEAMKFKSERMANNFKSSTIEDFMACDDKGFFNYEKYNKILKMMKLNPKKPTTILDLWAQREVFGTYQNMEHMDEVELLISNVQTNVASQNLKHTTENKTDSRITQLGERFGVEDYLHEMFFIETKNEFLDKE